MVIRHWFLGKLCRTGKVMRMALRYHYHRWFVKESLWTMTLNHLVGWSRISLALLTGRTWPVRSTKMKGSELESGATTPERSRVEEGYVLSQQGDQPNCVTWVTRACRHTISGDV